MKRFILITFLAVLSLSVAYAGNNDGKDKKSSGKKGSAKFQKKSEFVEPALFVPPGGFAPGPEDSGFPRYDGFNAVNIDKKQPVISTGYYFVDSDEDLGEHNPKLRPNGGQLADTTYQAPLWKRIVKGPNLKPDSFWVNNPEGYAYFRNPFDKDDSTDNAYAGPMPIGLKGGFYFNGIRYDSFFVSTNGVIALSNRRYFYDDEGNRYIPEGRDNCYDPMSMDWFVGGERKREYLLDENGDTLRNEKGNPILGDGLKDPVPDIFGHFFSVLGYDPMDIEGNRVDALLQPGGGNLSTMIPDNRKTAIVSPFWGDLHLSQWHEEDETKDDYGRAYYKRSIDSDSLIIAFFNIQLKGGLQTWGGNVTADANIRPGETNFLSADANVVFDRSDSTITFNYGVFQGIAQGFRPVPANEVFRCNTSAGLRGFARHIDYGKFGGATVDSLDRYYPWAEEYEQTTHYFASYCVNGPGYPQDFTSVMFKQWQNTLRVVDIQYRVRELDPDASLDFTEVVETQDVDEYELLAGNQRLGAMQPVCVIQNLTNDIQGPGGVNFAQQDLEFQARFRIENQITDRIIYNRIVPIDKLCMSLLNEEPNDSCHQNPNVQIRLAEEVTIEQGNYKVTPMSGPDFRKSGYNGVPPYEFAQVKFPPFEPNEFLENHIGRHRAYIIADPTDPASGETFSDDWPFDDTTSVRLFVMKRLKSFYDDVTEFHVDGETDIAIPSAYKWVNFNAEAVSAEDLSRHALPPRGEYKAGNRTRTLNSPAINMNRVRFDRTEPKEKWANPDGMNGDELRSFPIDMRGKFGSVLSISVQRHFNRKDDDWVRGWLDGELLGPEPRTYLKSNDNNPVPFDYFEPGMGATVTTDHIAVEFAKPSDDGLHDITNIPQENWYHHPGNVDSEGNPQLVTDMSALRIFGSGGYMRGFLKDDPDSLLSKPDKELLYENGLRADVWDDGVDFEFKKYQVMIPDTFIRWKRAGAKNFRFRVKVLASYDGDKNPFIPSLRDDDDDFLVDNINIAFPSEIADIEMSSVKVIWPYSLVPASQATDVPIRVKLANNSGIDSPVFAVKVKVFRTEEQDGRLQAVGEPLYCRTENVGNLNSSTNLEVNMPAWNVRKMQVSPQETYRLVANIVLPQYDLNPENDTTYTDFTMTFGDQFAYDPLTENTNNSVAQMVGPGGRGLNLYGSNFGGPSINNQNDRAGGFNGSGSGQIATKFNIENTDTIRGIRAFWGSLNTNPDYITLKVYRDNGDDLPGKGDVVGGTTILRRRAIDDISGNLVIAGWTTYLFPQPVPLNRGMYWASVAQMKTVGFELGAQASRSGTRTTVFHVAPNGEWGKKGKQLYLHKEFRKYVPQGHYENNNFFAYQNGLNEGDWVKFTPNEGNIAYPHFSADGFNPLSTDQTVTNGTWIPLIRPYLGQKTYGYASEEYQWCPGDIPVEILSFDGSVRESGIELYWETATETNNYGFYVERKPAGKDVAWSEVGFINGAGNSNTLKTYNYLDKQVKPNTTYEYRVKQVDYDKTESCATSNIVTLTYNADLEIVLDQNRPNPFTGTTNIEFKLPYEQDVTLEILDVYGNVVKTLVNSHLSASKHIQTWDGTNNSGDIVPSGTYIYRLRTGDETYSNKMSFVK